MAGPYVPLRIFSSYTMLEGAIEPKAIAKQAQRLDFPAAALTDRNGLFAAMAFTDACREAGVQPIVGTGLYIALALSAGSIAIGLPIAPEYRANVILNVERSLMIVQPLLEVELDDELTPGPVFRP